VNVPDWALPLKGHYAFRVHGLSKDPLNTVSSGDELWLGEIFQDTQGLAVRAEICQSTVTSNTLQIIARNPASFGLIRRRVILGDHVWGTDASNAHSGYTHDVPAACVDKPDQVVMGVADAAWRGKDGCRCPLSADATPKLDDCRVADPDGDLRAGVTLDVKGPSIFDARSHVAIDSRTHFRDGRVDPSGAHAASVVIDVDIMQLSCEPTGCVVLENVQTSCPGQPPGVNLTSLPALTPSGLAWTCPDVLAAASKLFPIPVPSRDSCTK
jgi:hypothetical protein